MQVGFLKQVCAGALHGLLFAIASSWYLALERKNFVTAGIGLSITLALMFAWPRFRLWAKDQVRQGEYVHEEDAKEIQLFPGVLIVFVVVVALLSSF